MVPEVLVVSSQVRSVHSGVGTYAGMVLDGLAMLPADVARVTVATWREELDLDGHPNLEWIDLGPRQDSDPTPGRFWSLGKRLVADLRQNARQFDVMHFLDAREGHAFVGSRESRGVQVIGTVHDDYAAQVGCNPMHYVGQAADPWRRFVFHRWQRRVEKKSYRRFDVLMVNSAMTGETIRRAYGLDPARLVQATLTVSPDVPEVARRELEGSPSLLFSGGNFYRKGLDICIKALPVLLHEFPDLRLHVAGHCRSRPKIERLAATVDVVHRVVFHGQVDPDDMAAMLAGADMFIMPSRTEALGLVYLEAFRAGVPVIAGDWGGVTEIVLDRKSGVLVTPGSPDALARAVVLLTRNEALRAQVIDGGREVLGERTPERLIQETLATYGLALPEPVVAP